MPESAPTPPTRAEKRQQTVRDLVAAAEREILAVGIERASIRGICRAAGYTLGAYYSNFTSKDDLVMAVAGAFVDRLHASLADILDAAGSRPSEETDRAVRDWLAGLERNTPLSDFALECALYSRHNTAFCQRFFEHRKRIHRIFVDALKVLLEVQGRRTRIPEDSLVAGCMALWQGQALGRWIVPSAGTDASSGLLGDNPVSLMPLFMEAMFERALPGEEK